MREDEAYWMKEKKRRISVGTGFLGFLTFPDSHRQKDETPML
jgi:hypothetical protein